MTLIELRDALAKATGPDRGLDSDIYIAFNIPLERVGRLDKGEHGVVGWWPKDGPYVSAIDVPRYTASIDAAATLVPEGFTWHVGLADNRRGRASFTKPHRFDPGQSHEAATPALALCVARLEYEIAKAAS
jgi:hypothetical protein